jgi:hypothetical protein
MTITESAGITGDNVTALTYNGFVLLKAKQGEAIIADLTPEKAHLLHMAVGVMGEVCELIDHKTEENFLEECGDIEFFLQGMTTGNNNIGWHEYYRGVLIHSLFEPSMPLSDVCGEMLLAAGRMLDLVKKFTIYDKPPAYADITQEWNNIHNCLDWIYILKDTTREKILAANVDKLNKRYVKGFSNEEAQQRNDKPVGD